MMVLVHDLIVEVGHGQVTVQVDQCLGLGECQREIVESQVGARGLGDGDGVRPCLQDIQRVVYDIFLSLGVAVEGHAPADGAHSRVVHGDGGAEAAVVGQGHGQRACGAIGLERVAARCADAEEGLVKQVTTAMIPGEVVHLVQVVVVVGRGVMGCREFVETDGERGVVALRQEVAAVLRIGVPRAFGRRGRGPVHGSDAVEHPPSVDLTGSHLRQVIGLRQVVSRQPFGLQRPAIAVELYLCRVGKACFFDQGVRQLIEARRGHADLRPCAFPEHGVVGIASTVRYCVGTGLCHRRGRHVQLEGHQLLVLPVAIHQRYQRHLEHTLPAHHAHRLRYLGQRWQRLLAELPQTGHILFRHVDEQRIVDAHMPDGVGVVATQLLLVRVHWQQ